MVRLDNVKALANALALNFVSTDIVMAVQVNALRPHSVQEIHFV